MTEVNREARGIAHSRIEQALKSEFFKDPAQEWLANQLVEAGFMLDNITYVDFALGSINYDNTSCSQIKETVDTIHYKNASDLEQDEAISHSETTSNTTTFSFTEGVKVGMSEKATVSVGIDDLLKAGVELTYFAELDFQSQQSLTFQKSKTYSISSNVKVPPQSVLVAKFIMSKLVFSGMFTASYVPKWTPSGLAQLKRQIDFYKEYKGVSLEPLKEKSLTEAFPDLNLWINCIGSMNGVAGHDITADVSVTPIESLIAA